MIREREREREIHASDSCAGFDTIDRETDRDLQPVLM